MACYDCQSASGVKSNYRVARRTPTTDGGVVVDISIRKDRFSREDLLSLGCLLRKAFGREDKVLVRIFDNAKSAKRYVSRWAQEKPSTWQEDEKAQRAYYMWNAKEGKHWIAWYDDPLNKKGEKTANICVK